MFKHLALALLLLTGTQLAAAPGAEAKKKKKKASKVTAPSSSNRHNAHGRYTPTCLSTEYLSNNQCIACSNLNNKCTACHQTTSTGGFYCDTCISGYYSASDGTCVSCGSRSSNCNKCTYDKTSLEWTCTSCLVGYTMNPTSGGGKCAAWGYYWIGGSTQSFVDCHKHMTYCSHCYNDLILGKWTCTSCDNGSRPAAGTSCRA